VKRGIFEIPPEFPPDIAGLITQMLSVDPTHRPTIPQIKKSSCFMRGLHPNYVLPAPIPFAHYSQPVDPSALPDEVMSVLRQIGYTNEEELRNDLLVGTTTMAKVFVSMLTTALDLERLPWESAITGHLGKLAPQPSFMDITELPHPDTEQEDPFRRMSYGDAKTPSPASAALRVDWCMSATSAASSTMEDTFHVVNGSLWDVMYRAQVAVSDCGLQYFHPDSQTVYVRKNDGMFYLSVTAEQQSLELINVKVALHRGVTEQFEDFRDRLWQLLKEMRERNHESEESEPV
jgi:hypothetical protein